MKRLSRRAFISRCAACTTCLAAGPLTSIGCSPGTPTGKKPRIRIIYAVTDVIQPGPDWPNVGYDFGPFIERIDTELARQCPELTFISTTASGEEEAKQIVTEDETADIDGYIVYQLNCWNRVIQTIVPTGKPVLYADFQYGGSGGFLVYAAGFLREQAPNFGFVASSDLDDLVAAVKAFDTYARAGQAGGFAAATTGTRVERTPGSGDLTCLPDALDTLSSEECIEQMSNSRILLVRDQEAGPADPIFGIPLERVSFAEVNQAWEAADGDESRTVAERWQNAASEVIDVPFETLETSAAMYLGMKEVLQNHGANAITINCLGGFYGGHIHAYPCLGFHELANEGLIGGCEADVRSAATMTAITALTKGRPGIISDPVIDTSKRQIIYAHCVAPNKMFGPQGPANKFSIMTHSEDRQGASVRSILPLGYLTTTLEIRPENREILFHQGKAVDNDPDDRACRTKLCAEPIGDIEKLFSMWDQWGWHRVTFYGDLKEPVFALADALDWTVLEEA